MSRLAFWLFINYNKFSILRVIFGELNITSFLDCLSLDIFMLMILIITQGCLRKCFFFFRKRYDFESWARKKSHSKTCVDAFFLQEMCLTFIFNVFIYFFQTFSEFFLHAFFSINIHHSIQKTAFKSQHILDYFHDFIQIAPFQVNS